MDSFRITNADIEMKCQEFKVNIKKKKRLRYLVFSASSASGHVFQISSGESLSLFYLIFYLMTFYFLLNRNSGWIVLL